MGLTWAAGTVKAWASEQAPVLEKQQQQLCDAQFLFTLATLFGQLKYFAMLLNCPVFSLGRSVTSQRGAAGCPVPPPFDEIS